VSDRATEITALVIALGILFSLICYLITNLSPGGMITPGWLALVLIGNARRLLLIGGVILLTYFAVRAVQRVVILYGKRLFATVVMAAVFIQTGLFLFLIRPFPEIFGFTTLGFIVPGLIAYQLLRQPVGPTLVATATVTAISYVIVLSGILLRLIPTSAEVLGLQAITSEAFSTLRLGIAAAVALVGVAVLVVQLRSVTRAPLGPAGLGMPGNGQETDPLGYITASERSAPKRPRSAPDGNGGPATGNGEAGDR
jgi:poly-gamma-glutamate biosynthesis protein PgsC/CapC